MLIFFDPSFNYYIHIYIFIIIFIFIFIYIFLFNIAIYVFLKRIDKNFRFFYISLNNIDNDAETKKIHKLLMIVEEIYIAKILFINFMLIYV